MGWLTSNIRASSRCQWKSDKNRFLKPNSAPLTNFHRRLTVAFFYRAASFYFSSAADLIMRRVLFSCPGCGCCTNSSYITAIWSLLSLSAALTEACRVTPLLRKSLIATYVLIPGLFNLSPLDSGSWQNPLRTTVHFIIQGPWVPVGVMQRRLGIVQLHPKTLNVHKDCETNIITPI